MPELKRSLSQQFILILSLGIVLLGSSLTYGFITVFNSLDTYDQTLKITVANERRILQIQSAFKKQIQEWKNTLLRGHDPDDLNKYWGKFQEMEANTRNQVEALLPELSNPEAKQLLNSFLRSHQSMAQAYRESLNRFKATGFDPKVGDNAVRGIDRVPTDYLDEAAALISRNVKNKTQSLNSASQNQMLITTLLLLLTVAVYSTLCAIMIKTKVIKPTQEISAFLQRFAAGDFNLPPLPAYKGELGCVSGHIQEVQQHLGQIIREVRETSQSLAHASGTFTSLTQTAQSNLLQQQSEIQRVTHSMDEMAAVVSRVSENTIAAADAARQATDATREGHMIVEGSMSQISNLAGGVENASRVIQQLESDVANIGTVLDVIRSIAEQTNLLALNAAIEAARAGEQGRGFAVVADEVRTLAGRTQESTSEIQEMIEKLEQGTANAVKVMLESRHQADQSVNQASSAGTSLDTIAQAVSSINEMNQQIAVSAKQQAAVTEEIHHNIININDLSQHTTDSAKEIATAGNNVLALAENMNKLIGRFKV